MHDGETLRRRRVDCTPFLSAIYFLSEDILLLSIYRIHVFLSLLVCRITVAEFDLVRYILRLRTPFRIIGHLGFYSDMGRFGLDCYSRLTLVGEYPNLHNPHTDRDLPNPHFDSRVDSFVDHSDNYCFLRISFRPIYFSSIPPFSIIRHTDLAFGWRLSFIFSFSFLTSFRIFS